MQAYHITKANYKVSDFITWAKAGTLDLSPSFQRRPVWKAAAKSYLMDTVINGYPIPIIFFRERKTNLKNLETRREVVDGQQRIRTLLEFIYPNALDDYKPEDSFTIKKAHNKDLANKPFTALPEDIRQQIMDYEFSVHTLPSNVSDREVYKIFARMNATGVKLNSQEIRNAEYFLEFKTSMYELGTEQLPRWLDWEIFTEAQISRMNEIEFTSELSQLIIKGIVSKTQKGLNDLYKEFESAWDDRAEVEKRFRHCMDEIKTLLANDITNTIFTNRAAFYGLFAVIYGASYGIKSSLNKQKATPLPKNTRAKILKVSERLKSEVGVPEKVIEAIERSTTHAAERRALVEYLRKNILSA